MAATITETHVVKTAGYTPALIRVYGTFNTAGGTSSGVIKPGENDTNVSGSIGCRTILSWGLVNNANSNAFKVVKSYDTTHDGDILTVTCTANDTFNFWVEGIDNGA